MNNEVDPQLKLLFWFIVLLILFLTYVYFRLRYYRRKRAEEATPHELKRVPSNPTIAPDGKTEWEAQGTFNPAAIVDDQGVVHLIYRAVGEDGISRFGYARSSDGFTIDEKIPYPIFQSAREVDGREAEVKIFNPAMYTSGGGWCGAEDPRAVIIGDRVYVTYVSFAGWHSMRMALTSISLEDLKKKRWNWKKPVLISPINQPHKNWVLFPEKIHGKYAIIHSVSPKILVEYIDDLDMMQYEKPVQSVVGPPAGGRKDYWDNKMRGAGAPPIKTDLGWLLLYHAMDHNDPDKYKLGAMILDLNDPTKILYRSHKPILSPCMDYENDYKPGVIYGSGAVIRDGILHVFYGGGDKHVCVAHTKLDALLDWLVANGTV